MGERKEYFDLRLGHLVFEFFSRMPISKGRVSSYPKCAPYCHTPFYIRSGSAVSDSIIAEGVADTPTVA